MTRTISSSAEERRELPWFVIEPCITWLRNFPMSSQMRGDVFGRGFWHGLRPASPSLCQLDNKLLYFDQSLPAGIQVDKGRGL